MENVNVLQVGEGGKEGGEKKFKAMRTQEGRKKGERQGMPVNLFSLFLFSCRRKGGKGISSITTGERKGKEGATDI